MGLLLLVLWNLKHTTLISYNNVIPRFAFVLILLCRLLPLYRYFSAESSLIHVSSLFLEGWCFFFRLRITNFETCRLRETTHTCDRSRAAAAISAARCRAFASERSINPQRRSAALSHYQVWIGRRDILTMSRGDRCYPIDPQFSCHLLMQPTQWHFERVRAAVLRRTAETRSSVSSGSSPSELTLAYSQLISIRSLPSRRSFSLSPSPSALFCSDIPPCSLCCSILLSEVAASIFLFPLTSSLSSCEAIPPLDLASSSMRRYAAASIG